MGRKSIARQRQEEILDAFEICIEKYGLANCSTHRISREANMKQPMISHYFGNKEAMVGALVRRIMNDYISKVETALGASKGEERIQNMLDFLFGSGLLGNVTQSNLIGHFLSFSIHDETLRKQMQFMYRAFLAFGEKELRNVFPDVSINKIKECAYGILCMAVGNDALLSLGIPYDNRKSARQCAMDLIRNLY